MELLWYGFLVIEFISESKTYNTIEFNQIHLCLIEADTDQSGPNRVNGGQSVLIMAN